MDLRAAGRFWHAKCPLPASAALGAFGTVASHVTGRRSSGRSWISSGETFWRFPHERFRNEDLQTEGHPRAEKAADSSRQSNTRTSSLLPLLPLLVVSRGGTEKFVSRRTLASLALPRSAAFQCSRRTEAVNNTPLLTKEGSGEVLLLQQKNPL